MVAATYCPQSRNNPQVLVSIDQLRSYFRDAETELYRSKGFRQILAEFKQRGALNSETQAMMKAMCREAIRSTLRQVCCIAPTTFNPDSSTTMTELDERSPQVAAIAPAPPLSEPSSPSSNVTPIATVTSISSYPSVDEAESAPAAVAEVPTDLPLPLSETDDSTPDSSPASPLVEASPATRFNPLRALLTRPPKPYVPTPEELRQSQLHAIGKAIQDARVAKAIPLEAVHQKTLVARHQIRAIEAGEGRWLPEDIYLKGFIRRMGDAVGLDGQALADQLTPMPTAPSVRPSWHQHSPAIAAAHMDPTRLYIGYAAVVAGSVWGLSWMSQHPLDVSQIPLFDSETGVIPTNPTPQAAQKGLPLQPTATVDRDGSIKIQFSDSPKRSPRTAETAAMERL